MKHLHHIIPRHIGGTDDPSNLIELTLEEHAQAHKSLYETYGRLEDYCAWQGLEGFIGKEEIIKMILSKTAKQSNHNRKGIKYKPYKRKNKNASTKKYLIYNPDGTTEKIQGLKFWCEKHNFVYGTFHKACVMKKGTFQGYRAEKC